MKLNKLKSVVNQTIRSSSGSKETGYLVDPFYYYRPKFEINVDLVKKTFTPDLEGDDVEKYYRTICDWFHEVLPKEGIAIEIIESAILKISPEGKKCVIKVKGKTFQAHIKY